MKRLRDTPRSAALRLLSIRQRSVEELRKRLQEKGYSSADVDLVVAELGEQGLLGDKRFAEAVIEDTLARHPVGRLLLQEKLRRHLVPKEIAEEALSELLPPAREADLARVAAQKKLSELRRRGFPPDSQAGIGKLARFLQARGFVSTIIETVLVEVEAGVH